MPLSQSPASHRRRPRIGPAPAGTTPALQVGVVACVNACASAAWAGGTVLLGLVPAGDVTGMVLAVTGPLLARAIRWVNRPLYLSPTYADGHLQAGRLLIMTEHRRQGFEAMRRAWELSPGDRRTMFIVQIVALARSSSEVRRAIPRRVPALDVLDEAQVDRLVIKAEPHPREGCRLIGILDQGVGQSVRIENASVVVLCLTLQFVRPIYRERLLRDIYNGLNTGGVLILVEKILAEESLSLIHISEPTRPY